MSEPIKVGDLVIIVRSCCDRDIGVIRRIEGFDSPPKAMCAYCAARFDAHARARFEGDDRPSAAPVAWLKRIPPLSELEGERTQEDIREPA